MIKKYPTPFHLYDEKGIRENARKLYQAFSWNKGFKEYLCGKGNPKSVLFFDILKEVGMRYVTAHHCTELMMSDNTGIYRRRSIMFSSNDTPAEEFRSCEEAWCNQSIWMISAHIEFLESAVRTFLRRSAAVIIRADSSKFPATISWTTREMPSMV